MQWIDSATDRAGRELPPRLLEHSDQPLALFVDIDGTLVDFARRPTEVRLDADLRGKTAEEITGPLIKGIKDASPAKEVKLIPEEMRAIAYALEHATPGSFVAIFTEDVQEAIKMVENFKVIQDRRVLVE